MQVKDNNKDASEDKMQTFLEKLDGIWQLIKSGKDRYVFTGPNSQTVRDLINFSLSSKEEQSNLLSSTNLYADVINLSTTLSFYRHGSPELVNFITDSSTSGEEIESAMKNASKLKELAKRNTESTGNPLAQWMINYAKALVANDLESLAQLLASCSPTQKLLKRIIDDSNPGDQYYCSEGDLHAFRNKIRGAESGLAFMNKNLHPEAGS